MKRLAAVVIGLAAACAVHAQGYPNRAVRVVQAVLDTLTCWAAALLALAWAPAAWRRDKRRRVMLIALALAAACPFTAIYVATILTETCATLLAVACLLTATWAMKTSNQAPARWWSR